MLHMSQACARPPAQGVLSNAAISDAHSVCVNACMSMALSRRVAGQVKLQVSLAFTSSAGLQR